MWKHRKCSGIKVPCVLILILGAADALEQHGLLLEEQ